LHLLIPGCPRPLVSNQAPSLIVEVLQKKLVEGGGRARQEGERRGGPPRFIARRFSEPLPSPVGLHFQMVKRPGVDPETSSRQSRSPARLSTTHCAISPGPTAGTVLAPS